MDSCGLKQSDQHLSMLEDMERRVRQTAGRKKCNARLGMSKYASMQVCKYASMQVCKYASMYVCMYASK